MNFPVQTTQRKRDRERDDFEEEHRVEPLKKSFKGDKIRWEKLKLHSYGILIIKIEMK